MLVRVCVGGAPRTRSFIACEGDRVPLTDPDSQLNRQRLLSVFADATLVFIFSATSRLISRV